jgi:hypothetical protein
MAATLAIAWLVALPLVATAANVVLDGGGGGGGRTDHAIGGQTATARYATRLHVFSYDATAGDLRWGVRTATGWSFSTIDGAGGAGGRVNANVGEDQAAAVYGGRLHVLYYDRTHGDLRHGTYDGSTWTFETVDGSGGVAGRIVANVGLRVSASAFGGSLRVAYANTSAGDVRLASWNGTAWSLRTLDGAGGTAGRINGNVGWNTASGVFGGNLHVFYFFQDPVCDIECHIFGSIREATFDGSSWTFSTIDDINCCFRDQSLALAKVSTSNVYLFYENFGLTTQNLRAFRWNGTMWIGLGCVGEPFEQDDIVGSDASAAVVGGRPRVTYFDAFSNTLGGSGVAHTALAADGVNWRTSFVGIASGGPTASINADGLKVFVGAASIVEDVTPDRDLVLATPPIAGVLIPPDTSCG